MLSGSARLSDRRLSGRAGPAGYYRGGHRAGGYARPASPAAKRAAFPAGNESVDNTYHPEGPMGNPISDVQKFGQSIWYDNIRRGLITQGELHKMIQEDGLLGVTSNPAIFTKAITGSPDYDQPLKALVGQGIGTAMELYEKLA